MNRHEFLIALTDQIRTKRARPMIVREIESHIEDQKTAYMAEGMTAAEAEGRAVEEMGDPVEIGIQLDRIHRPRMEWKVLAGVIVMSVLGILLQTMVIVSQSSLQEGVGASILYSISRRQVVSMIGGIALMMVICYIDYSLLEKYAFWMWALLNAWMAVCIFCAGMAGGIGAVFGTLVNGKAVRAATVSYFIIPFYAGTVYHFRRQGTRGLMKSIACLLVSLVIINAVPSSSMVCIVGSTGIITLSLAIHKGWFGEQRKKLYAGLWGTLAAITAAGIGIITVLNGALLSDYQTARLEHWIRRESWDYPMILVTQAAEAAREGGSLAEEGMMEVVTYIKNDYLWAYIFDYLGSVKGILLIAVFAVFMILLFRLSFRQKNRLGYIVSVGCTVYLGLQAIMYVGMNFGFVPIGGMYMPFLSNGSSALLSTYFYMGILLSIYRNSNVVHN